MKTAPCAALAVLAAACAGDKDAGVSWQPRWGEPSSEAGYTVDSVAASASGDVYVEASGLVRRWSAAERAWTGFVALEGLRASRLAADGDGGALAVGVAPSGRLEARRFPPGAAWPGPWTAEPIAPTAAGVTVDIVELVMTESGAAAVTWRELAGGGGPPRAAFVALREPSGAWTAPILVGGAVRDAIPAVALADLGGSLRLVAAWYESHEDGSIDVVASVLTHAAGGGDVWEAPTPLLRGAAELAVSFELGLDRAGRASVLVGSQGRVLLVRHTGTWRPPIEIVTDDASAIVGLELAADPDGEVLATWTRCADVCELFTRRWVPAGLGPPVRLDVTDRLLALPRVVSSGGRALALWGSRSTMIARERQDGAWGPPRVLGAITDGTLVELRVALAFGGAGAAAWTVDGGGLPITTVISYAVP